MAPNDPQASRKFLGHTIYLVTPPSLTLLAPQPKPVDQPVGPPATPKMPKLAFTVTNTHLIFGFEPAVERTLRTESSTGGSSLASAKWFNIAKAAMPSAVGMANLQDDTASAELLWWMLKQSAGTKSPAALISPNPGIALTRAGGDMFNFALLPEFDAARKYFGLSVFYGISRADGFFFEFKDISPQTPK
jgi:hypothetical protein